LSFCGSIGSIEDEVRVSFRDFVRRSP
jgi:hypothetical protein